jgi:23S rRNA (adenine2503-C2)-methyltransferase
LHGIKAKVNLIPYNEHPASPFKAPAEESVSRFQGYLLDHGMVAMRRASKGQDISAACGQLKGKLTAAKSRQSGDDESTPEHSLKRGNR